VAEIKKETYASSKRCTIYASAASCNAISAVDCHRMPTPTTPLMTAYSSAISRTYWGRKLINVLSSSKRASTVATNILPHAQMVAFESKDLCSFGIAESPAMLSLLAYNDALVLVG